jgi:hypothetical protein
MNTLPIHVDPSMWTDEQIAEILRNKVLLETLRDDRTEVSRPTGAIGRLRAFLEEASKRRMLKPRDIGEWRERGIWGLWLYGDPIGFFHDEGAANLSKQRIVNMLASGGTKTLPITMTQFESMIDDELQASLSSEAYDLWHRGIGKTRDLEVWKSINGPLSSDQRRRLAEKSLDIKKAPREFKPFPEAFVGGGFPTEEEMDSALRSKGNATSGELESEIANQSWDSEVVGRHATHRFVQPWADELNREANPEHPEHEFMVKKESLLPLSKRVPRRPPLSKRAASGPRSVGDKIALKGFGKIKFEVVGISLFGDETYYKVKPVDTIYGVSEKMVEEEHRSEKIQTEKKSSFDILC